MDNYFGLLSRLTTQGDDVVTRGLNMKEIINEHIFISESNFYSVDGIRDFDKVNKYLIGELSWYFSGNTKVDGILRYSKFWDKIKNEDGTVNSNYGHSVFYKRNKHNSTQFDWAYKQLIKDEGSRQAIILYNDADYYFDANKDFVCTQLQQFLIRDNKLISIIYIRSSDVIKGLTYDIPFWSIVQQQLLLRLKEVYPELELGVLFINFGSVHIYESDLQLVNSMLKGNVKQYYVKLKKELPLYNTQDWYENKLNDYIEIINK